MKHFKEKLKTGFIKHRTYLGKGMSELYNFKSVAGFILLLGIWLQQRKIIFPTWIYIFIGIFGAVGCWYMGLLWDKAHMYEIESDFGNERNPAIKKLLRKK